VCGKKKEDKNKQTACRRINLCVCECVREKVSVGAMSWFDSDFIRDYANSETPEHAKTVFFPPPTSRPVIDRPPDGVHHHHTRHCRWSLWLLLFGTVCVLLAVLVGLVWQSRVS
jgi:hypothetical protein